MSQDAEYLLKRLKKQQLTSDQIAGLYDYASEQYEQDVRALIPQPPIELVTMGTDFILAMKERASGHTLVGLPSGYPRLDWMLRGFERGDFTVIAGGPARGKTLLAHSILHNMALQGTKSLFISLEMSPRKIIQRTVDMHEGTGDLLENAWMLPIFFYPKSRSKDPKELRHYIGEIVKKEGIQMVVLDHLGMLPDLAQEKRHSYGEWMKHFRSWCDDFNISLTVLAHINKLDDAAEPQEKDMAESQSMANFADQVILVWREKDAPDATTRSIVKTKITKNRNHDDMGKIFFRMNKYYKLEELSAIDQAQLETKVGKAAKSVFGGHNDL
jgi:replicative DNA helicase